MLHGSIAPKTIVHLQHWLMFGLTETSTRHQKMAYYNAVTRQGDVVERLLGLSARFLETTAQRYAARRVYRTTLTELSALSDRELADLGMHRSHIKRIAWISAFGNGAN